MKNISEENKITCVVEYGTLATKRDMIRVLRDLDKVQYIDLINNVIVSKGEGFVIEVYSNSFDSTIIFNERLHLNVNAFDYLTVTTDPQKEVILVSEYRKIKLLPISSPHFNQAELEEDIDEQRVATMSQLACDNEEELDYFTD